MRPGVVDLRDLASRYAWHARAITRFIADAGLEVGEVAWRGFAPPRVLVLIAPFESAKQLARSRPWLAEVEHLIVVRDGTASQDLDADLREAYEDEWREELAPYPHVDLVDWIAGAGDACRAALAKATATVVRAPMIAARAVPDLELPIGTWIPHVSDRLHEAIGVQLAIRDGRAVIALPDGEAIELASPPATLAIGAWAPRLAPTDPSSRGWPQPGRGWLGVDPVHPIAWRGGRMHADFFYVAGDEAGFLSVTDHDFPCGPAKKLWGYDNNDARAVAMAPAADACVQTFDHDVLVTTSIPIAWHRAGAVDVAAFARDLGRALLYAMHDHHPQSDDLLEEDNRGVAPTVVLGPDATARYAVDLSRRTVRLVLAPSGEAVGEVISEGEPGFAVFDAAHALVRRGRGRLLGGWYRHATIDDGGELWREDLATGARTHLGSASRAVCVDPAIEAIAEDAIRAGRHAEAAAIRAAHPTRIVDDEPHVIAIPGTRNVLEVGARYLRVL